MEEKAYLLIKTSYGKGATPVFSIWEGTVENVSRTHRLGEVLDVFASVKGAADAQVDAVAKLEKTRGRNSKVPGINLRPMAQKRNNGLRNLAGASALLQNLLRDTGLENSLGAVMRANLDSIRTKIVSDYEREVRRLQERANV